MELQLELKRMELENKRIDVETEMENRRIEVQAETSEGLAELTGKTGARVKNSRSR